MTSIVNTLKGICGVIGQRIDTIVKEELESIEKFYAQYHSNRTFDGL